MLIVKYIALILIFIFLGSLLIHGLDSINQDIGRHLKSGQIIWETKSVYKTNLFSFTEPNHPFINHHWLSEVIFYLLNNLIGLKGLVIFKTGIILSAFSFIFLSVHKKVENWAFLASMFLALFVFIGRTDVRPEIFSYLFLSFFLFAILRAKYSEIYKYLYILPVVQIFWVNMHIYFALGPMLRFFFLIDRRFYDKNKKIFKKILLIFTATIISNLINPNFIKGAIIPFTILKQYSYSIVENQSVFFLKNYGVFLKEINLFALSLFVLTISFAVAFKNGRKNFLFEVLTAITFLILAMSMVRNFAIYAIAFIPIVAFNFNAVKKHLMFDTAKARTLFYVLFSLIMPWLTMAVVNNNFYLWLESPKKFGLTISEGAEKGIQFIKQNKIPGPVFNNFDVGSFLIWKLYPEQKVFVDGRPEAYSMGFFEKIYKPMQENPAMWKKYSEEYKINYIFFDRHDITPWARSFLDQIPKNPDWPLIYLDESAAIFLERTPENKKIIDEFEI